MSEKITNQEKIITLTSSSQMVACPPKDQKTWNHHPRVYLSRNAQAEYVCPYCGNRYTLNA